MGFSSAAHGFWTSTNQWLCRKCCKTMKRLRRCQTGMPKLWEIAKMLSLFEFLAGFTRSMSSRLFHQIAPIAWAAHHLFAGLAPEQLSALLTLPVQPEAAPIHLLPAGGFAQCAQGDGGNSGNGAPRSFALSTANQHAASG